MTRIRSIKPESCLSETLAGISDRACLLFAYLPCFCDDEGRMRYSPQLVKAQIFPLRDHIGADECERLADELARAGLVRLYEAEGRRYLAVTNFSEHQKPPKFRKSELPAPPPANGSEPLPNQFGKTNTDKNGPSAPNAGGRSSVEVAPDGGSERENKVSPGETTALPNSYRTDTEEVRGGRGMEGEEEEEGRKEKASEKEKPAAPGGDGPSPAARAFGAAEPSEEDVRRVVSCINRVARKRLSADTPSVRGPIAVRLAQGASADDLCAVAACKAREWAGWEQAKARLVPKTLFGRKFEEYLADARAEGGAADGRGMYD